MKVINILFFFFIYSISIGQLNYYQETCKCGVTGAGFSTGTGSGSGVFDIYIEAGSSVKKAYLFGIRFGEETPSISIPLNGNNFQFDSSNSTNIDYNLFGNPQNRFITTHAIDVTTFINPLITSYSVTIPPQFNSCVGCKFDCVYLFVLYENPIFTDNITSYILLNNKNEFEIVDYEFSNLNPIELGSPLSFATYFDRIGADLINDGSYLFFDNGVMNNAGLIGGVDNVNPGYYGAGVKGHFYYQNNTLYGLDDDTPDNIVGGTDGLADVNIYIHPDGALKWRLQWEAPSNSGRFNAYNGFFLTHTTTCDTFSVFTSPDTSICKGETVQLFATGGTSTGSAPAYEWLPATDLSCSDCPNPIFTGDSSRFYTVRIWNNDSCSVVRPVKVNVRPLPKFGTINSTASHCGTSNGSVSINAVSGTQTPITYTLNDTLTQNSGTFTNLASGSYTFNITDAFGCVSNDTTVNVGEVNTTVANFTVSPAYGVVPLAVDFTNTSVNATDYLWSINGLDEGGNLNSYTCDTSGLYSIQLIAWQYDPSCADTIELTVLAVDQIIIPTAFTPDNDGVNDRWVIPNIKNIYPKHLVRIYNRWGTLIYEAPEGKYSTYPWKGVYEDEALPVGSYYFIIDPNDGVTEVIKGVVSIIK